MRQIDKDEIRRCKDILFVQLPNMIQSITVPKVEKNEMQMRNNDDMELRLYSRDIC